MQYDSNRVKVYGIDIKISQAISTIIQKATDCLKSAILAFDNGVQ